MKYLDFYQYFSSSWNSPVFGINDIKNVFPDFNNVQLSHWQKKAQIVKIRKDQYFIPQEIQDLELLAYDLKKSYISMEYALSKYGWIPEAVFQLTAITPNRSEELKTPLGTIIYRQIKPTLFLGYELSPSVFYSGRDLAIAIPEKALFDLIYFRKDLKVEADFQSLRLSINSFKLGRFKSFIKLVKQESRRRRLESLLSFIKKEFI